MDFLKIFSDNPHSIFNTIHTENIGFLNSAEIGRIFYHNPSGLYIGIDYTGSMAGISFAKWTWYLDAAKDDDSGKWIGIDPIGEGFTNGDESGSKWF